MKRYALHFLLLLNISLVLALGWLWLTPDGDLRHVHWQPPAARTNDFASMLPALPGFASPDTGQFLAMLERPLFSMSRRPPLPPPPPPPPAPVAAVDNLSTARLLGIFDGQGAGGVILTIAGKTRRVRLSDAVDGWTVQSIQGRAVTFTRAGETRVLQMQRAAMTTYSGLDVRQGVPAPAPGAGAPPPVAGPVPGGAPVVPPARRPVFGGS